MITQENERKSLILGITSSEAHYPVNVPLIFFGFCPLIVTFYATRSSTIAL